MKICPNCKTENGEGNNYCKQCGNNLPINANNQLQGVFQKCKNFDSTQLTNNSQSFYNKSFDAILYVILGVISIILVFCKDFFKYYYCYNTSKKTQSDYTYGSFTELVKYSSFGKLIVGLVIISILAIVINSIVSCFKNNYTSKFNIICSSIAFISIIIGTIAGNVTFDYDTVDSIYGSIYVGFERSFEEFGMLFYIELIILGTILLLSLLHHNNKFLLGKKNVKNVLLKLKQKL